MTGEAYVLAICGCTNAGKTTMARAIQTMLIEKGQRVALVSQDDFYHDQSKIPTVRSKNGEHIFDDWDAACGIDSSALCSKIEENSHVVDYIIVEGNMLTEMPDVMATVHRLVFLTLNQSTCIRRRATRNYSPQTDAGGYFDEVVWPAYERYLANALKMAKEDSSITFLDASREEDANVTEHVTKLVHSLDIMTVRSKVSDVGETSARMESSE